MTITFNELRQIKDSLSDGSIQAIASELGVTVETVRNYFGGEHYERGDSMGFHIEPGPDGGIVVLEDTTILEKAKSILESSVEDATSENQLIPQRSELKQIVRIILREDATLLKGIIREILEEDNIIGPDANEERKQRIEAFISEEFDRYDDVFQALS